MSNFQDTISPLQQSAAFELAFRIRQPQPTQPKACVVLLHGVGASELKLADFVAARPAGVGAGADKEDLAKPRGLIGHASRLSGMAPWCCKRS